MKHNYGKLLFILSLFLTRPSAKADLLDIYARLQGECNPAAQKFSVTNATWKVNAYNAYTADNVSGGGQCLVKCDINGNGKPDYIMTGPGIMNRSATTLMIALDLPDLKNLKNLATAQKLPQDIFPPDINVVKCGDVNGDGIDDIVLGVPKVGEGYVAVFFGSKSLTQDSIMGPKAWEHTIIGCRGWSGANFREFFGKELELVDFNSDGILDIWTSAWGNPKYGGNTFGRVLLIPGRANWKTSEDAEDVASLSIGGSQVTDHIGVHLAVGDLNRDGKPDLIFSSPYHPGPGYESGKIWIIWGGRTYPKDFGGLQPGSILDKFKEFPLEPFGLSSISTRTLGAGMMYLSTGDFDGDGCSDLIVGSARYGEGKVDVLYGPLTPGTNYVVEQIQNRTTIVPSEMPEFISAQFGGSLLAGDIDGDGCADLLVGAKGFSQYKTGSRTGEGGAFLFSGSKRRPRYIQTGDSVARFLFEAGHNIEGGLGLAYVVSNQKPWICVADPVQGETYGFTFDNLPFVPVKETYSYSSATNIQWKITSAIKHFNIPASLTNTLNPYADILAALTNANVNCWAASVQKVDTDILQNNKIVANVYIKTEPIPDRINAVWGQIRQILQKNNIPRRDLLLVPPPSYNNMSIKHVFGRTSWPGFEAGFGGWIDNQGVWSLAGPNAYIPIAFTSIHTKSPTATEIAAGVVAPIASVTGDIYLLPNSLEQNGKIEFYKFSTRSTAQTWDGQIITPVGLFPTVRLDFLDKYQNVLFSSSFYCPADAFGVNVPVNDPSNGLYFDQSAHYGSQLLFPGHSDYRTGSQFLRHTLEMPFSVLNKISEIRCELTTQTGPRIPSVGFQDLDEVTPRRLIVGLSEFSNYEYVVSTEESPCVYQDLEVPATSRVTLEVLATGITFWEDMNYQWFVNGKLIPGATNWKQDFLIAQAADYGLYTCEIRYSAGASKLLVATVTAPTPPAFSVQPESANLTPGDSIMLKTVVEGTKPIRLQWYKNRSAIPGATNSFLAIVSVSAADSGTYSVQGQNSVGTSVSQTSTVLVDATPKAPLILIQPDSLSPTLGDVVTFSVLAKGFPVPAYQWSKDSTPIAGATNSSLLIAAVTATDYGSYTVTVKNSVGSSTSEPALLGGNPVAPSIIKQPVSQTINKGDSTSLSVSADGTSPLQFQWRKDGQNLPQATNSTLVITDTKLSDAGNYQVTVTNPYGTLASDVIYLAFKPLEIPRLAATYANGVVKLLIPARTTPMRVEESQDLAGWARIKSIPLTGIGVIVDVYDRETAGSTESHGFFRLVPDVAPKGPTILVQPSPASLVEGQELGLTVEATGSGNLSYQWRLNDLPILGAVLPVLRVAKVSVQDAGRYTVIVTDSTGSVASNSAAVSVSNGGLGVLGMVRILAGTFLMGSPVSEPLRYTDETQHQVQLTRDFLICDHEVTQAEYKSLVGNNPSGFRGDDLPVESVTWAEAVAYCEKLTLRERAVGRITQKQIFRLPTEAEWEYACRAGTTGQFSGNLGTVAWYQGNSESRVHSVKSKPANGFGLHDMHGNVSEWCADWYGSYPNHSLVDPVGPAAGTEWPPGSLGQVGGGRVVRGGNYQLIASSCRSATRMAAVPRDRYDGRGFRVVLASIP